MSKTMKPKGLAITMLFESEGANYGEGIGNISPLKKITLADGKEYPYISRQAIAFNIVEQMGYELAPVDLKGSGDKKVVQFTEDATIDKFVEIDLFGYMKTEKGDKQNNRTAKVRVSNAIATEPYMGELDFLTNKGLADRIGSAMNISQSEIHSSYYRYTIVIDLDQIGVDKVGVDKKIEIPNEEKAERVNRLLDTVLYLYRDIKGRREDLKPVFVIGGVYDIKNPVFKNMVVVKNNVIDVDMIEDVMTEEIKKDTICGVVRNKFKNDNEIRERLNAVSVTKAFEKLKEKVSEYYESN